MRQIVGLDLLRFAAAALVLADHIGQDAGSTRAWTWFGWVGVQVFFLLSGFVISYSAQDATPMSFLKGRVVRLMPTIWLCSTFSMALAVLAGTQGKLVPYLKTLVLWPTGPWIEGVYWTLPVEVAFYALVFAVLLGGLKARLPTALMAIAALSALYWAVRLASVRYHFEFLGPFTSRYLLLEHGIYFAAGGLLWACLLQKTTWLRVAFIAGCAVTGIVQIMFTNNGLGGGPLLVPAVVPFIAIALIVASVKLNRPTRHARLIRFIGLTTYPLYLLHRTAGGMMARALTQVMPDVLAFAITCVAMTALAALVAGTAEPFLQARLRALLTRPAPA